MSAGAQVGFVGEAISLAWPTPHQAWVTLTRSREMNTITLGFIDELSRALDAAEAGDARALAIIGSGRAFCCGAEIGYFTDPNGPFGQSGQAIRTRYVDHIAALFSRLEALPFPTLAAINGYAFGGGCELALACDLRLMAEGTAIGVTEVHVGAIPGAGGIPRLVRLLGRARATELTLLGLRVSAEAAARIGLVTETVAAEGLRARADAIMTQLAGTSPRALAEAKHCLAACEGRDMAAADTICLDAVERLASGSEWLEGMSAFTQKRRPSYRAD